MGKLIAHEWMTLDGVVQAPSYPDEDRDGGFTLGGWHNRYWDDAAMQWLVENVTSSEAFLLGRRTYEIFANHWPNAGPEEQALAEPLNTRPKYVASRTIEGALDWNNSTLLSGDAVDSVAALKNDLAADVHLIGSADLLRSLMRGRIVDELRLMVDPIIIGGGKRFFPDDITTGALRLASHSVTSTGAILATYEIEEG
jgi:dihydrofolate reductase